jgi:ribosomal protein S12 methylthiotransferase
MKSKKQTINIVTLGCSKNLVDSEVMMRHLSDQYTVYHDSNSPADVMVINTCGFIHDAKEESVDTILRAVEAKNAGDLSKVYVTGCLSERYKNDLKEQITDVDGFFGTNDLANVLKELQVDYKNELLGERVITTPKHYAYLKISEGCNRTCSFCAIPLMRGKHKSKSKEEIIKEAEFLAANGVKEILLIAQELTYYGIDLYNQRELPDLINKISEVKGIEWIRLHYAYPSGFPLELLDIMRDNPKVCNYLDIPLQHINNRVLAAMKRRITAEETLDLVRKIKATVPGVALRTTLIVGFPGETEEEFKQLMNFVGETRFDRLGVFTYSHEEHTGAFMLKDDVPAKVKQERLDRLMEIQQQISFELNQEKVGKIFPVLIDRIEGNNYIGRTEFDSPEVDNEVLISSANKKLRVGKFYPIRITKADFFDLYGELT